MPNSDGVVLKSDSTTFDRDKSVKHFHGSNYSDVRGISENILEADMRIVLLGSGSIIVNLSGSSSNLKIFEAIYGLRGNN